MAGFTLVSNDGTESATWTATGREETALICDVSLRGVHWGLGDPPDLEFQAEALRVPIQALSRLHRLLEDWLDLPLTDQSRTPLVAEEELGSPYDYSLVLKLGRRAETLSERNPVASLVYVLGPFRGEFSFVTDQSCLRRFCDGISKVLRDANAA